MYGTIFASSKKRETLKKVFAGFMALSLNLSLGGVASILTSNVAYAITAPTTSLQTFNTSDTFTVPTGVTSLSVEAWGGGAGGGQDTGPNNRGGGGGGAYAKSVIAVTPGQILSLTVGAGTAPGNGSASNGGDTFLDTGTSLNAKGGVASIGGTKGGAGGSASASIGNITTKSGGNGGDRASGQNTGGGGGGGSATVSSAGGNGVDGSGSNGGAGGTGQGAGGKGGNNTQSGVNGSAPGGGGGGRGENGSTSGSGANGRIVISWVIPTPPDTNWVTTPPLVSNSSSADFRFSSTPTGATFECSLDGATFSSCTTPRSLTSLSDGSHTFQARAVLNGLVDPTPASFTWTVHATTPENTAATCSDNIDNDGDNLIDLADPDCAAFVPVDVCPNDQGVQTSLTQCTTVDPVCSGGQQLVNHVCVTPAPVCNPNVNLLQNSSFEAPVVSGWDTILASNPLLKWFVDYVTPNTDTNAAHLGIEIQAGVAGNASNGTQLAELDGYHPSKIWQNVPTISGMDYKLSFDFSARPGTNASENILGVTKDDVALMSPLSADGSSLTNTAWTSHNVTFQGTGANTKIGFADLGNDDSGDNGGVGTDLDNVSLTCVGPHVPKSSIVATKIVCDNESDLPNWSGTGHAINANTATDYVNAHSSCHLASDWQFQWANTNVNTSIAADYVGAAGEGWNTFSPTNAQGVTSAEVPFSGEGMTVWVREVLKSGYVPFSYPGNNSNVSAEMYCNGDVKNYDNLDYANAGDGQTTYCVAFNAPKAPLTPTCPEGQHYDGESCVVNEVPACVVSPLSFDRTSNTAVLVGSTSGTPAVLVDFDPVTPGQQVHIAWTANIPRAQWIWGENPADTSVADKTESFFDVFTVTGTPTGAHLDIAADNTFEVYLNGGTEPILTDVTGGTFGGAVGLDIPASALVTGSNTLEVRVKNLGAGDPQGNPAGLLYNLHVNYNTICEQPPVDVCTNIAGNQSTVPEGMTGSLGICTQASVTPPGGGGGGSSSFDYWGCTNPAATNFNPLANKDDNSCKLPGGNGGNGNVGGGTSTGNVGGEVLGAATTTAELPLPAACMSNPYLRDYLKLGKKNDADQVKLLQTFLNEVMSANLPVSGFFGNLTKVWVKKFQKAHNTEIIQPWVDAGFSTNGLKDGTGYVYKTTKRAINMMRCNAANIPMPDLTPDTGN